jgi:hypothetical protein
VIAFYSKPPPYVRDAQRPAASSAAAPSRPRYFQRGGELAAASLVQPLQLLLSGVDMEQQVKAFAAAAYVASKPADAAVAAVAAVAEAYPAEALILWAILIGAPSR